MKQAADRFLRLCRPEKISQTKNSHKNQAKFESENLKLKNVEKSAGSQRYIDDFNKNTLTAVEKNIINISIGTFKKHFRK